MAQQLLTCEKRGRVADCVGLGQHDHGLHARALHQGSEALQATQVEIIVEAHHQQGQINVADHRMPVPICIAPHQMGLWQHALVYPTLMVSVLIRPHPVADRQCGFSLGQRAGQPRQCPRAALAGAVMHLQSFSVQGGQAHQLQRAGAFCVLNVIAKLCRLPRGLLRQCSVEAHRTQAFEVDVNHDGLTWFLHAHASMDRAPQRWLAARARKRRRRSGLRGQVRR